MAEEHHKTMIDQQNHTMIKLRKLSSVLAMAVAAQAVPLPAIADTQGDIPQTCGSASAPIHKPIVHNKPVAKKRLIVHKPPVVNTKPITSATFDNLAVDPSISLKDTPAKEIDLPGVLHVDGESVQAFDQLKAHKISWGNQGIQPIMLSLNGPDLIVTPFNDPYIVGNSYLNIKKRSDSNNVYVSFNFPEGVKPVPVSIFIEDPAGGPALGLQLTPKQIPQQVYTIVDDTHRLSKDADKQTRKGADYTSHIQELMEIAAFGGTPSGYSVSPFDLPPMVSLENKLVVVAVRRLSNTEGDLYVYKVTNPTAKTFMLDEKQFDGPRVKAVSIFPNPELHANEKADVIVFAKKLEEK